MVGASGGEFGIYGWLKGLDLKTGKIVWTGHNIGPDAEMLIKPGDLQIALRQERCRDWAQELGEGHVEGRRGACLGLDHLRPGPRPAVLRRGQPVALQHRTARRRQQVDGECAGSPAMRRGAGVGIPIHPARRLGLRRDLDHGAGRPHDRGQGEKDPGRVQQERLPVHHRPDDWGGARGHALRGRHLGEARGPHDRTPGARSDQADRRIERAWSRTSARASKAEQAPCRRPRTRRGRDCSTPPPTTCAWTTAPPKRRAWPGRRTSAPTRPYHVGPAGKDLGAFIAWDSCEREEGVGIERAVPRMERRSGDGWRRGVLRHPGRMVQVGRREDGRGVVEVQGGLRRRGQSDHIPRPRWQAVRGDLRGNRRRSFPVCRRRDFWRSRRMYGPRRTSCRTSLAIPRQGGMVWIFGLSASGRGIP